MGIRSTWRDTKKFFGGAGKWVAGTSDSQKVKFDPNSIDASAFQMQDNYSGNLAAAIAGARNRTAPTTWAAGVDTTQSDQIRGQQMSQIGQLQARASGSAPSAAEMQMRQGLDSAIASQRSAAASARGVNRGLAQKMAAQGIAGAQADITGQAGALRAQEQAQAEQNLASTLAGMRGADLQTATTNAGLQQQTNLANQQAELSNRAQMDQAMVQYINMGMSREQASQQAAADLARLRANAALGVATSNAQAAQQARAGAIAAGASVAGAMLGKGG